MRKIKIMALCVSVTALCCYAAYRTRGYIGFGGEWMVWMAVMMLYLNGPAEQEEQE